MTSANLISFKESKFIGKKIWHLFLSIIFNICGHIIIKLRVKRNIDYKFNSVICGIFKNESIFLEEWVKYHLLLGIDHIYLLNNGSTDEFEEVLKPFIEIGQVTLIDWPKPNSQFEAYEYWYKNYSTKTKWFSFLDIDEFICPVRDLNINTFLEKYEAYPALLMYWKMFGTGGQSFHDSNRLVTEQYINSWDKLYDVGKVFVQSRYTINKFNADVHHSPRVNIKFLGLNIVLPVINEYKIFVVRDLHLKWPFSNSKIRVNHYWSKALDIHKSKMTKSDVAFKNNPKANWEYFYRHETNNISSDYTIYRFLIRLKNSL